MTEQEALWDAAILVLAVVVAAFVFGGCAAPEQLEQPYRMTFAPASWSAEQTAALHRAAERWSSVAIVPVELVEVPAGAGVSIAPGSMPDAAGRAQHGGILLRADLEGEAFEEVAMHELGHVLGLGHVQSGVMRGDSALHGLAFSAEDLSMCVRVGVCAPEEAP